MVVENTRFRRASNSKTTPREFLACALNIRRFQKQTRLYSCDIVDLRKEIEASSNLPGVSRSTGAPPTQNEKVVRKAELEKILLRLLPRLNPETFQVMAKPSCSVSLRCFSLTYILLKLVYSFPFATSLDFSVSYTHLTWAAECGEGHQ